MSRRSRDVGGKEGKRCPLRLFTAPGAVEDQLLVHFCLSTVMVRRPSSCASVDVIRCPSSLAKEGKSSLAAGSPTPTPPRSPLETRGGLGRTPSPQPPAPPPSPAAETCVGS